MSKKRKRIDHPDQLALDFESKIEEYQEIREDILSAPAAPIRPVESFMEACIEIAASIKRAIRQSGLSRGQVVDGINEYFGWVSPSPQPSPTRGEGEKAKEKYLSIHMFNHYLSKPTEYPISSFYIYAIQYVTGCLDPTRTLAEAEGARVISGDEVRQMTLGKLDETISEMQRLKKELKGMRHG